MHRNRSREFKRRRAGLVAAAVWSGLLALSFGTGAALAEDVQRVEAVGTYAVDESKRGSVISRDEAVEQGIWEGVSRVATQLLEAEGTASADLEAIRAALGSDVLPYTRSFRILKDRGESAAQFSSNPKVRREYVVLIEALVDLARVRSALASAGLMQGGGGFSAGGRGEPVLIELVGVARFPAFEGVRRALRSKLGATRVETLGFARERQLISVEGPFGPGEVYSRLSGLSTEGVQLRGVGVDEAGRRVRFEGIEAP